MDERIEIQEGRWYQFADDDGDIFSGLVWQVFSNGRVLTMATQETLMGHRMKKSVGLRVFESAQAVKQLRVTIVG